MMMITAEREQRAMERAAGLLGEVERVAPKVWAVPSQSQAGELHVVVLVDHALRCDCLGYGRSRFCTHTCAVRAWIEAHNARRQARRAA